MIYQLFQELDILFGFHQFTLQSRFLLYTMVPITHSLFEYLKIVCCHVLLLYSIGNLLLQTD